MVADDSLDSQVKAKLDDSELSDDLPKALQKVDLDLDDAPFLDDEPEEPAPESEPETSPFDEPAQEEAKPASKKRLIILVAVLIILLAGGAAFFLLRKKAPPPPVKAPTPPVEEAPVAPPLPPEPPPGPPPKPKEERIIKLAPFLVELTDAQGRTHLMSVRFAAATYEASAELEFKRNRIVVRDAVYYYLKNKPMEFYTDKQNAESLKKDVLSVINQFVGVQPLDNLLIEDLLVK